MPCCSSSESARRWLPPHVCGAAKNQLFESEAAPAEAACSLVKDGGAAANRPRIRCEEEEDSEVEAAAEVGARRARACSGEIGGIGSRPAAPPTLRGAVEEESSRRSSTRRDIFYEGPRGFRRERDDGEPEDPPTVAMPNRLVNAAHDHHARQLHLERLASIEGRRRRPTCRGALWPAAED
jgi:hypothetical protein